MIVCVGDSITYGEYVYRELCWTSLLRKKLGVQVLNQGVCADTTRLGLERFPAAVQEHEADTVVIQFGLNDCNRWDTDRGLPRVSPDAFRANLNEMIDRARTFGATRVVLCTTTPTLKGDAFERESEHYSNIVRCVAHDRGTLLADVRDYAWDDRDFSDGVHLTESAHLLYAYRLLPVLQ